MEHDAFGQWASGEFGLASLGDSRLNARLEALGSGLARRPAGRITEVFSTSAEREGAYRFVNNEHVDPTAIGQASARATFERSREHPFLFVPIDGSSLALTDDTGDKGFGVVGARKLGAPGLQVMTAIGVAPDGVPEGLLWQHFWARKERSTRRKDKADRRPPEEKETRFWNEGMAAVRLLRDEVAPAHSLWFQLDRGGDAGEVLLDGLNTGDRFTVRAAYDRRVADDPDQTRQYLRQTVESADVAGIYTLDVVAKQGRAARQAKMAVRFARVTIRLQDSRSRHVREVEATAVLAREEGTTPPNEKPLDWLLLTNGTVTSFADACLVLRGYRTRWRIEEFHKAWKSGVCNTESTLLRSGEGVERLARISAAVAVRVVRLSYLARNDSQRPAGEEFPGLQLKALAAMVLSYRLLKKVPPLQKITVGQAVDWIARLGGYTGKSSGGPPGFITINRGLEVFDPFVSGFGAALEM
jgi:hypothetical protein